MDKEKPTQVLIRLTPELAEAVDAFRRAQEIIPSRPEVVRLALTSFLRERGHLNGT